MAFHHVFKDRIPQRNLRELNVDDLPTHCRSLLKPAYVNLRIRQDLHIGAVYRCHISHPHIAYASLRKVN